MMELFSFRAAIVSILVAAAMLARALTCGAQITVGHVDDFQDGTAQGWLGANVEVVANTGPNGAGDTALRSSATGAPFGPNGRLIIYNNGDPWTGNWTTAGVAQISLDVRNPNAFPLTMRLAIAGPDGFFGGGGGDTHSTDGISVPGDNAWHSIIFDVLADNFTSLSPTHMDVAVALAHVTHFRVLHHPEHSFVGEAIDADFLVDNIRAIGAATMLPGDYNRDGTVDAADYVVWRKFNNTMTTLPNDSTPGDVSDADYDEWRAHFGQTAGGGSSSDMTVPEPAGALLLIFCVAVTAWRGRRIAL